MENKLEQNKWYKITSGKLNLNKHWYVKFNEMKGNTIGCTDYINDSLKFKQVNDTNFGSVGDYTFTLIDLSEIQEYLPEGHIDKFPKEMLLTNIL